MFIFLKRTIFKKLKAYIKKLDRLLYPFLVFTVTYVASTFVLIPLRHFQEYYLSTKSANELVLISKRLSAPYSCVNSLHQSAALTLVAALLFGGTCTQQVPEPQRCSLLLEREHMTRTFCTNCHLILATLT